ncbi:MAG TPA: sigma factor-like helix-turn-helix DNA-binding protein [Terriglobia bacterium]|nr:sigma factor-like helix-turn-helix DNA-binding protein [Terriglobia bacterium]
MPEPPSADGLLTRIAERDASALAELYDLMAPGLLALAREILSSPKDAAAVVEDVFLWLFKEAPALRQHDASPDPIGASVAAWLTLSTRAAALGRRRAGGRVPRGHGLERLHRAAAWLPKSQAIRLLDERRELLKKVMRQLPEHQIEVLSLAVLEGCSETEIATRLSEPLGQVRTESRAALRFLRHRLRAVLGEWTANI